MKPVTDTPRLHDKGVQQTSDGWKLTYVTYRSYDEQAGPQPMLCYVLQRQSAAADYRWSALIVNLVKSVPFQMRRAES